MRRSRASQMRDLRGLFKEQGEKREGYIQTIARARQHQLGTIFTQIKLVTIVSTFNKYSFDRSLISLGSLQRFNPPKFFLSKYKFLGVSSCTYIWRRLWGRFIYLFTQNPRRMASDRGKSIATSTNPPATGEVSQVARLADEARASQTTPSPANPTGSRQQTPTSVNPSPETPTPTSPQVNPGVSTPGSDAPAAVPTTVRDPASPATPATMSSTATGPNATAATQSRPAGAAQAGTARGTRPPLAAAGAWPQGWEQFPGCFDPQFQTSLVWTRDGSGRPRPQYPTYQPSQASAASGPSRPRAVTPASAQGITRPAAGGSEAPISTQKAWPQN